ncbi:hypothetical protein PIB30_062975 [Stylosanthes scabra]|uniref:Cytochrome c oxidase subunit 5C n=1 Tax=Stylosanthes scabra TaxID=79078 RepID=A0ABU6XJA5_9FABA|nr:hypothetical protein [Stylosanthes scabra]
MKPEPNIYNFRHSSLSNRTTTTNSCGRELSPLSLSLGDYKGSNWKLFVDLRRLKEMAGPRIAHATLKGPSVIKEICIATVLGIAAGSVWKMHHWNEQRKVRAFYDLLEKGEISVIAQEE